MTVPTFGTNAVVPSSKLNALSQAVRDLQAATTPLFAYKAADESLASSTTLQDDDDLRLSVEADSIYELHLQLIWQGLNSAVAGGLKVIFSVPAGTTLDSPSFHYFRSTSSFSFSEALALGSVTGMYGTGANQAFTLRGLLVTSGTPGSVILQWAQDVSNATATILRTNSYLTLEKKA